jgi:hypothetical protein
MVSGSPRTVYRRTGREDSMKNQNNPFSSFSYFLNFYFPHFSTSVHPLQHTLNIEL